MPPGQMPPGQPYPPVGGQMPPPMAPVGPPASKPWYSSPVAIVGIIALVAVLAIGAIIVLGGGDGDDVATDDTPTTTAVVDDSTDPGDTTPPDETDAPVTEPGDTEPDLTLPTDDTGGVGLDLSREQQEQVLDMTWENLSATDRDNLCQGVEMFGADGAADLFNEGADNSFDLDLVQEKLASWCAAG